MPDRERAAWCEAFLLSVLMWYLINLILQAAWWLLDWLSLPFWLLIVLPIWMLSRVLRW